MQPALLAQQKVLQRGRNPAVYIYAFSSMAVLYST